ncbi:acetyl-CoA hydrolase/transferase family protein [Paraburkholderia sp. HD33-4]|uniref:acetyl-CoA hydrolase/transferase family protein n=1 Tax=Paraburkholderia sp. HD33-4 TaxID=2883242 RepID=UPI001F3AB69F|nr:acetyl-CoA hydrolase/transferase C-terminal domain-containing protein [Paraburkholderia sp. HD33-4]
MKSKGRTVLENPLAGAEDFPFESVLRPGDRICFGQACSEPTGLVRELLRQGERLHAKFGRLKLFICGSYSGLIKPEHGAWFDFEGYGAIGDSALLERRGLLDVHPVHYSQLPALMESTLRPDVMLLQLSGPDLQGRYSLGAANDFQSTAARSARVVIAELTSFAPFSPSALLPDDVRIDHVVRTDLPLIEVTSAASDDTAEAIASHVAGLIEDGATLQLGVGSLMDAICRRLINHKDLGVHGGIMTDGLAELMMRGNITNARKGSHPGRSVIGSLLGTRRLFDFADNNDDICLSETDVTHSPESLGRQYRLSSINSAVEVDLSGQVNAEVSGGRYIGAVGGQLDFVRAAVRSPGGKSIIALPSTARGGSISRIVSSLHGPVTTPRSDVEYVVTEWGVACLRGRSITERMRAMLAIAHPNHREALSAAVHVAGKSITRSTSPTPHQAGVVARM